MAQSSFSLRVENDSIFFRNNTIPGWGTYNDLTEARLEIICPDGEKILFPSLLSLEGIGFSDLAPFNELVLSIDSLHALNAAGKNVLTLDEAPVSYQHKTFRDGRYRVTFSLTISGNVYTDSKFFIALYNSNRAILSRINPSVCSFTHDSKEERETIDTIVRIIALREGALIDFAAGRDYDAGHKLEVMQKLIGNCPVLK